MVSSISISQDNNGVERFFFKDDFSNDTLAQYTVTGTPTIAAGVLTMAYGDKIERVLPSTCTTGKWEMVAQFDTDWVDTDQAIYLYIGDNSYYRLLRITGDVIWSMLWINGQAKILETTTRTLASNVDFRAEVIYDGTNYTVAIYGMSGAYTKTVAASSPTVPSIGVKDYAAGVIVTAITVNEITFCPSIAYTDTFGADTSTRYAAVTGTVAFSTDHLNLTTGNVAGNYVRERLRSYQFGRGNRLKKVKLPAACVAGDYVNIKMCATGDLLLGYGLGVIRQADATWHICTVKDVTVTDTGTEVTGLVDGDYCYIETDWNPDQGVFWGYVYETTKPTAPQVTIFDATYNYGYTGVVGYTNEAVAKEFQLWSIVIRANNIIGRTTVPSEETGFHYLDTFPVDSTGRYTITGTGAVTPGYLTLSSDALDEATALLTAFKSSTATHKVSFADLGDADGVQTINSFEYGKQDASNFYWVGIYYTIATGVSEMRLYKRLVGGWTQVGSTATVTSYYDRGETTFIEVSWNAATGSHVVYMWQTTGAKARVKPGTPDISGTDTTFTNGRMKINSVVSAAGAGNLHTHWFSIEVSGTRYYLKPMLRGAQVDLDTPATRFSDDFNWATDAEFTGIGTGGSPYPSVDTTNGRILILYPSRGIRFNSMRFDTTKPFCIDWVMSFGGIGNYDTFYMGFSTWTDVNTGAQIQFRPNGQDSKINGVAFSNGGFIVNQSYKMRLDYDGTTTRFYCDGVLIASTTTVPTPSSTSAAFGFSQYAMNSALGLPSVYGVQVNAHESTSTNGVTYMIGGVPHGMRYDTQEEVYLTTTTAQQTLARLRATLISTNYATDSIQWYYENTTDSSSIDVDTSTKYIQIVPDATPYAATRTTLTLGADDIGDTIKCALRRHAYAVANDNQPAVFCDAFGILATVTVTDSVAATDAISASRLRTTVADSVALTDAKTTRLRHTFTDSVALSDAVATRLRHTFTDSVAFTDRISGTRLRTTVLDTLLLTDLAYAHLYKKVVLYNKITRTITLYNELSG